MRILLGIVASLSLLALHCTSSSEDRTADDEADHTAKEPTYANSPYFWAETDYATFKSIAQAPPFRVGAPLGAESIVTKRLQAWSDRVHEEVRKDVREKTGQELVAARPLIVVVPAEQPNAWVSGVPACVSGEADLSALGTPGRPAKTAALAFLENARVKEAWAAFGAPPPKCTRPSTWTSQDDLLAFFNATGSKCKLEKTSDETVKVTGAGCALDKDTAATKARQLTYYATSPYIHFTTAMIALADDEKSIVGTIAHELGHYYRSHSVSDLVMGRYNYWYEQKDPVETAAPSPAADSADLEAKFRRVVPYPMAQVLGQKLSYRITNALTDGLGSVLERANVCPDATSLLDGELRYAFGALSGAYVDRVTREKYLAYEKALLACAPNVQVTAAGGAGELKLADVQEAITRDAHEYAQPAVTAGTLAIILETVHQRAAVLDREATGFHESLESRRLGRWTAEQEADDFAMEYYARVGLEPKTKIDAYLDLIKARFGNDEDRFIVRNGGLTIAACESLHRADWMQDGQPAFVPLGNLHDPHHGDCYRLFNMAQELRAHGYRAVGTTPSLTGSWGDVQAEAKRATDAFVSRGPDEKGGPSHMPQRASGEPSGGPIVDGF